MCAKLSLPRLMVVTDRHATGGRDLVDVLAAAAAGGARFFQVRERDLPPDVLSELVEDIKSALPPGTLIVVNGRPEMARECGCGLHLSAAAPLPEKPLPEPWGRAVHDEAETARALSDGARYLVVGTIYPTPSKPGFAGAGPQLVRRVVAAAGTVPVFAIGGVDEARIAELREAGAYGAAVRRAVLGAADPAAAARRLVRALGAHPSGRSGAASASAS